MREKYPITGHFGNTHGIPPFTEYGGGVVGGGGFEDGTKGTS